MSFTGGGNQTSSYQKDQQSIWTEIRKLWKRTNQINVGAAPPGVMPDPVIEVFGSVAFTPGTDGETVNQVLHKPFPANRSMMYIICMSGGAGGGAGANGPAGTDRYGGSGGQAGNIVWRLLPLAPLLAQGRTEIHSATASGGGAGGLASDVSSGGGSGNDANDSVVWVGPSQRAVVNAFGAWGGPAGTNVRKEFPDIWSFGGPGYSMDNIGVLPSEVSDCNLHEFSNAWDIRRATAGPMPGIAETSTATGAPQHGRGQSGLFGPGAGAAGASLNTSNVYVGATFGGGGGFAWCNDVGGGGGSGGSNASNKHGQAGFNRGGGGGGGAATVTGVSSGNGGGGGGGYVMVAFF